MVQLMLSVTGHSNVLSKLQRCSPLVLQHPQIAHQPGTPSELIKYREGIKLQNNPSFTVSKLEVSRDEPAARDVPLHRSRAVVYHWCSALLGPDESFSLNFLKLQRSG